MAVNDKQVGGTHYQTGGAQHWDLFGPEYLIGCATKYVSRWRKKNGVQDLEKAKHFCEKLLEIGHKVLLPLFGSHQSGLIEEWCRNADMTWQEASICMMLFMAQNATDVRHAIRGIEDLITSVKGHSILGTDYVCDIPGMWADPHAAEQESAALAAVAERRVPRYFKPPPHDVLGLSEAMKQRTPEDGAQHASLHPYDISKEQFVTQFHTKMIVADKFYYPHASGRLRLRVVVESDKIPAELQSVYTLGNVGRNIWYLNRNNVPDDLKDEYKMLWEQI